MKMNYNDEKIIQILKNVSLSGNEKREIKSLVFERISRSREYQVLETKTPFFVYTNIFKMFRSPALAFASMMLIIFAGVGVSSAAERSLPGDVLYPVKIHINEGIRSSTVAFNPVKKAGWNTKMAERRLMEAQKLAFAGRLDEKVEEMLGERFLSHTLGVYEAVGVLQKREDLASAIDTLSELEALLSAHQTILASQLGGRDMGMSMAVQPRTQKEFEALTSSRIASESEEDIVEIGILSDSNIDESSTSDIATSNITTDISTSLKAVETGLLNTLQKNISELTNNRAEVEIRLNNMSEPWLQNYALTSKRRAEFSFANLKKAYGEAEIRLNDNIKIEMLSYVNWSENLMEQGLSHFKYGEYKSAINVFNEVSRISNRAKILVESHATVAHIENAQKERREIENKINTEPGNKDVLGSSTTTNNESLENLDMNIEEAPISSTTPQIDSNLERQNIIGSSTEVESLKNTFNAVMSAESKRSTNGTMSLFKISF